jgi:hypothetical protein
VFAKGTNPAAARGAKEIEHGILAKVEGTDDNNEALLVRHRDAAVTRTATSRSTDASRLAQKVMP